MELMKKIAEKHGFLIREEDVYEEVVSGESLFSRPQMLRLLEAVSQALEQEPALHYIYMANVSVPACVEAVRKAGKTGQVRILAHDISPEIRAFLKEGVQLATVRYIFLKPIFESLVCNVCGGMMTTWFLEYSIASLPSKKVIVPSPLVQYMISQ